MSQLFWNLVTHPLNWHDPTRLLFYGSAMAAGLCTTYLLIRRRERR